MNQQPEIINLTNEMVNRTLYEEPQFKVYFSEHMSHHDHADDPCETDWDCRNCSGANCEGCKDYTREEFDFNMPTPERLRSMIRSRLLSNLDTTVDQADKIAEELMYSVGGVDKDYFDVDTGITYRLEWPTRERLFAIKPEWFNELYTIRINNRPIMTFKKKETAEIFKEHLAIAQGEATSNGKNLEHNLIITLKRDVVLNHIHDIIY